MGGSASAEPRGNDEIIRQVSAYRHRSRNTCFPLRGDGGGALKPGLVCSSGEFLFVVKDTACGAGELLYVGMGRLIPGDG